LLVATFLLLQACDSRVIDSSIEKEPNMNVYTIEWTDLNGKPFDAHRLQGSVTLVVNVASKCGYTKQYATLQELHDTFDEFQVIGIPCNDFGGQEPGDADVIQACATSYNASFPIMQKTHIVDEELRNPLYEHLYQATGVLPEWNFGKYLIDKDGAPIAFFGSNVEPASEDIVQRIEKARSTP